VHVAENLPSESFEQLAMPHFERLYNLAHWLTHDRQEAEDMVQETYAKTLNGFSSFQPGTNFCAWIYRILRNAFLTSRTGLKATAAVPLDLEGEEEALPAAKETPESILLQRSDRRLVQQALEELPVANREILLLCEVEEMSYQEISAALAISMGTVMSRLSRARKALRSSLQQQFAERVNLNGDLWFVSLGRRNSTLTLTVKFQRRKCAPSTLMCAPAALARRMPLRAYR
jgi:RNA polymerase sigma-70 factor (ECF subfamily)